MAESKVASLEGHELADDYSRTHIPQGRWGDTWDLFKSNFVKFVIINVLTLLFFVPGIVVIYFKDAVISQMGTAYPFSSNPLFSYPLTPSMQGVQESFYFNWDARFYALLFVAGLIASVGIAGACYSIKKLINTHGQFSVKGYFHGVKVCYFNVLLPVELFLIFLYASLILSDWSAVAIANGASKAGPITAKVFIIIATVVVGVVCAWVLAVGVSYKVKLKYLIKNSFVLLFGTIIQTIFMLGFSLIPVWFLLIGESVTLFKIIGYALFIFFGFSFIILCWLAFTQWAFDMYITPAIKSEEEARKASLTPKQLAAEKEESEKAVARELLAAGRSELVGRPMRPIDGGTEVKEVGIAYGRADIKRVSGDRQKIKSEVDGYIEEHKGDTRYVEYERLFAEREKALSTTDKKGKKKKLDKNNLLSK
ncbi:MAG: hypothetical protein NC033_03985 [Clostridiales bacterium]|nr:hypothetical protein [Clostridiales bacterium]